MPPKIVILLGFLCIGWMSGPPQKLEAAKKRPEEQKYCPIFTNQVVGPDSRFLRYKGIRVYFSSDLAARKWLRDPASYLDPEVLPQIGDLKLPGRAMEQKYCPVSRTRKISTQDPWVMYQEKRVYLFDREAVRIFNSAPEKFIDPAILPQFAEEETPSEDEESAPQELGP